jgi:hypothetical protein
MTFFDAPQKEYRVLTPRCPSHLSSPPQLDLGAAVDDVGDELSALGFTAVVSPEEWLLGVGGRAQEPPPASEEGQGGGGAAAWQPTTPAKYTERTFEGHHTITGFEPAVSPAPPTPASPAASPGREREGGGEMVQEGRGLHSSTSRLNVSAF